MNAPLTASIATNDPENDPTPRVKLRRIKNGDGGYAWVGPDREIVATGNSAKEADDELSYVYNFPGWDLRFDR